MGSALPNPVRQQFQDEIDAGRVLVLVDTEDEARATVDQAMASVQASRLDYGAPVGAA